MAIEFAKELGHSVHEPEGPNLLKVTLKVANGYVEGLVTSWAVKTIANLAATMLKGLEAETASGGASIGAWITALDFAYSVMLVIAIDAITLIAGDAAIDSMFSGKEK